MIQFLTNKRYWENSYEIIDNEGNVIHSKDFSQASTIYYDTLDLDNGCYEFIAYDTGGDGMYNWPSNHGTGYIKFYDIEGNYYTTLEEWFGEEIRHQFVYLDEGVSINNNQTESDGLLIYPNPANDLINIKFMTESIEEAIIRVYDITGKISLEDQNNTIEKNSIHQLNISSLNPGIYLINIISKGKNTVHRIVIE